MGFSNSQHMIRTKGKTLAVVAYGVVYFLTQLYRALDSGWNLFLFFASVIHGFSDLCIVFV